MKVNNTGSIGTAQKAKKKGTTGGAGGFASHISSGAEETSATGGLQNIAPMAAASSILALQEVPDSTADEGRRALYQRGEDILDRLTEIQEQILSGGLSKDRLLNLAQLLRQKRDQVDDEKLLAILDEIEIRAEVEIAKWTRAGM